MKINEIIGESVERGVAEGFDKEAEAYKEKLLSTLPQMMQFYEKNVEGWKPSKEQMLAAIDTGYIVMKHTGDVKQSGKAMMDELNTLHRMSQGNQSVTEAELGEAKRKKAESKRRTSSPNRSPVPRFYGAWGWGGEGQGDGGGE